MTARELYLRLATVCDLAAATTLHPQARAGMLSSAAVWRRLADTCRPATTTGLNIPQDKLAVPENLEMRSFSALPIQAPSGSKN
jgi:hypothetical protein